MGRAETAIRQADAVLVCAPTDQRPALCAQAARAGRPLLVEKPIARTAAEARGLAREVQRSRTPAMVALHLRQVPAVGRLAGVLREGLLGRLASVSASQAHPGALDGWFDGPVSWVRDRERAGVGGFGDLAFNLVDLLGMLPADEPPRLADRRARSRRRRRRRRRHRAGHLGGRAADRARRLGRAAGRAGDRRARRCGDRDGPGRHARAGARCRRPERWVGAPPDAGEAVRAFAAALRARRLPREGLSAAVRVHETLESAIRVG